MFDTSAIITGLRVILLIIEAPKVAVLGGCCNLHSKLDMACRAELGTLCAKTHGFAQMNTRIIGLPPVQLHFREIFGAWTQALCASRDSDV